MTVRLAKRTRRRGALDKAVAFASARAARLLAAPPLRSRYQPRGCAEALASLRALERQEGRSATLEVSAAHLPWAAAAGAAPAPDAAAIVLMCDGRFFGGSYEQCAALREELEPLGAARPLIIASDAFVSDAQVRRAHQAGADAIAPVALVLDRAGYRLAEVVRAARDLGLLVIPECAEAAHLEDARAAGLEAVIISLRDRDTFRPCLDTAAALEASAGDLLTLRLFAHAEKAEPD